MAQEEGGNIEIDNEKLSACEMKHFPHFSVCHSFFCICYTDFELSVIQSTGDQQTSHPGLSLGWYASALKSAAEKKALSRIDLFLKTSLESSRR